MKKKKSQERGKITIQDYIKAVKKADRETQLETNVGFTAITKVHKSKKLYNRKNSKKDYLED
ncbi:hypothetical protein G7050_16405 [Dysgonomonas sp. HDW5A]|uniref:hypothetical protein n=1 Tax=Dysgonomonas sp. HDW5A TaxID=2714926 RepID=UPI00140D2AAE|nr:hypothetical protein [Dysgonomonas sp. HDW5A]QIK61336.1 hypothetical protein G7050_16405 [Dysgonomonas sp. HDW5A]